MHSKQEDKPPPSATDEDFYGDDTGGSLINHLINVRNRREKRKASAKAKPKPNGNGTDEHEAAKDAAGEFVHEAIDLLTLWRECGLKLNSHQVPYSHELNASQLLTNHPDWRNRVWFDEFRGRMFHLKRADPEEWADADDVATAVWMQKDCGLPKMGVDTVRRAVNLVGHSNVQNECRGWLQALEHDGTPRVEHFLTDIMGATDDEYTRSASRNFWLSLAARVIQPGCQVDHMLVLEGAQGIGKSSALRIIGGDWYAEAHESLREKDFFLALKGKLLVEITEMDAFSRADTARVKQVVSCRVDRYRAPYEARTEDHPRHTVFCGTTNDGAYLRDATGGRRFWPVKCGTIRLDLLKVQREQLFAEAVARYDKGESWWAMPVEAAKDAQDERRHADPWERSVLLFVAGKPEVSVPDILGNLGLEVRNFDKVSQMRVADLLTANGWERTRVWKDKIRIRVWIPKPASSS